MPSVQFTETEPIQFQNEIPRGVKVKVASDTAKFDITFNIGGYPENAFIDKNGAAVNEIPFRNVKSINPFVLVLETFPLEIRTSSPHEFVASAISCTVTNQNGQVSNPPTSATVNII